MAEFVHLHAHTQYSFLVSMVRVGELAVEAERRGMRAVAITDHANMYGAIRHYNACNKAGIRPILGCELNVARANNPQVVDHLVLLAATQEGYHNLIQLVSFGYLDSVNTDTPSVSLERVAKYSRGIVGLTGCLGGVLAQTILENGPEQGEPMLAGLRDMFEPGHLFVEMQDHGFPEQPLINSILADAAKRLDVPIVATNDVQFLNRDDAEAQRYLECIRLGRTFEETTAHQHQSSEMYLKTPAEMAELFRDYPDAIKNTLAVSEMCAGLKLNLGSTLLPSFPVPEGYDVASYFRHIATLGLEKRFSDFRGVGKAFDEHTYRERLERELGVIIAMQYPGYFLIVWDFIREAKDRGIPVGPGRGSGAGSLVAYALGITEIDPLPYNLLFERFLNPERISMPDFDVDFCMARRDEVIGYVADKYGKECVGQIATFQNLKARSVIKDVARAMSFPAPEAQRIASLVPSKGQGKMCTITEALVAEPKLRQRVESEPRVAELIKQAIKLEDLTRHAGTHAAGVVISDGPLVTHVPCFRNGDVTVTQYDKDDVEAAGLIKFDFLGLKTLTVIDIVQRLVNARPDRKDNPLDLSKITLEDRETYALVTSGETTNVFQLESSGMQALLRQLKPDCFEDIVAAVALYRPGPLGTGMIDDFVGGKHGRKAIRKLHPLVDAVLAPTYGVPVYQEQVMQIAQYLAGYSLGAADLLRRAMGKKKAEEMQKQLQQFVDGAVKNGVAESQALAIFREVEGFASYGFNKSHSAAYALVTYHTAYLKAHYPTEFFAGVMTADREKIEKVVRTIAEARAWGVSVLPPDINASATDFSVVYKYPKGQGTTRGPGKVRDRLGPQIRFGLGAVRGVGEAALETMFDARQAGGKFADLFDFAARVDAKRLNKGVLESLVQCGAFDSALEPKGITRARAYAAIDRVLERSRNATRDRERGQTTLFGMFDQVTAQNPTQVSAAEDYPRPLEWDGFELLKREKQALGCYVSGHPLYRYGNKSNRLGAISTAKLAEAKPWSSATVAGMVENYEEKMFRGGAGGKVAFFQIEDTEGRVHAKLRQDRIETYAALLKSGEPILVTGKVSFPVTDEPDADAEPTLLVDAIEPLADAVLKTTRSLTLRLPAERAVQGQLLALRATLEASPGPCPVELILALPDGAQAVLDLPATRITITDAILASLERMFGQSVAELR